MSKAVYALISQLVINSLILIILAVACNFLPDSPFKFYLNGGVLSALQPYMKYINWFCLLKRLYLY